MKQQVLAVRNPVWADADQSKIDCVIRTSAFSVELPFTASADDPEEHGRDVFRRCLAGEFGEIGPYAEARIDLDHSMQPSLPNWEAAWPEVHAFINEANEENVRGSPRAIGLVWGSMLEVMLRKFIESELKRAGRNWKTLRCPSDNTRNGRRCGSSFSDLIKAAV